MDNIGFDLARIVIQDISQIRSPVGGSNFRVTQMGRGRLSGRALRAFAPDLAFSVGHLRGPSPLRFSGEFEPGQLTIVLKLGAGGKVWGVPDSRVADERFMFSASHGEYDTATRGGLIGHASLRQAENSVLELASVLTPELVPLLGSPILWLLPKERRTLLRNTVFASIRALRTLKARPRRFFDIQAFRRTLTAAFLSAIEPNRWERGSMAPHVRMVRMAEDLLIEDDTPIVSVAELCLRLGVGRRSLERAFRHFLDVSPLKYMIVSRLSRAHHELAGGTGSVTEIATRHGFYELGRFSARYRRLFEVSPSETLAQGKAKGSASDLTAKLIS